MTAEGRWVWMYGVTGDNPEAVADGVAGVGDRSLAILGYGAFGAQAFGGSLTGWLGIALLGAAVAWAVIRGGGEGRWWSALLATTTVFFLLSPAYYRH